MELPDFRDIFAILHQSKYDHESDTLFEACFKNWTVSSESIEGMFAAFIRLALFEMVVEFSQKSSDTSFTAEAFLIYLLAKSLGIHRLSQLIEIAERGLEKLYYMEGLTVFGVVLLKIFKWFSERIESRYGCFEEVMQ
jgi:hypothetical protein